MNKKFLVVNSFAEKPFEGNPAGIVFDADDILEENLLKIARQLNLVETVFVYSGVNKEYDFHIRYFTPNQELPIAGHPTIALFIALYLEKRIDLKNKKNYIIKTKAGLQDVNIQDLENRVIVKMKQLIPKYYNEIIDRKRIANILGIDEIDLIDDMPVVPVYTGLGHIVVPVKSYKKLMEVRRNIKELKEICKENSVREVQAFTFETSKPDIDIYTRNICPREGIEDPGCGIGNSALGAYLAKFYYTNKDDITIKASQGHISNMPCLIETTIEKINNNYKIWVGGSGLLKIRGEIFY